MLSREYVEETSFSFSTDVPGPAERRVAQRHMTILRVGTLIVGQTRELCLIRNISAGGLMAHIYCPLDEGQRVSIELKTNQVLSGQVIWAQDSNVGIAFDQPIDVAELLANPPVLPNGWRHRMPRVEVDRMATLRAGARVDWVQVKDVSQGGAKLQCSTELEIGGEVVLTMEGFRPVAGIVRWHKDGFAGINFIQVIPFADLIDWLKRDS